MARPESIEGGCLCGAIRFKVTFPQEEDWPPQGNGVCQCTMCRKHGGSVLPQNVAFPRSNVSPPLEANATYKKYQSSTHCSRGFCSTCGSALTFDEHGSNTIEINIGAFDEEVLCGRRDEANAWEDGYGRHVPRVGGVGKELCYPKYHIYVENAIPGVTDDFPGPKYLLGREGGKAFTEKPPERK
ncbi:hypothetical protein BU24DRAFT_428024 [Aaosphaeria arxii CBS 175.79]|uniref:CENP-V/GFA domain-containing protein n=1 Tax=Aaosphaeria arxii CBS 175.79 TaxID=1450172 RepID=A0A6A5XAA0_9PLEO|nr:uncharacterized protein BU24DRAFT_428024 [Aaosphaeria arxii CBS 175.79]KAF2009985.1 hypothetical protein BU24DRAFT_428024 [Aaosphaeria arxii CBS 175.79]